MWQGVGVFKRYYFFLFKISKKSLNTKKNINLERKQNLDKGVWLAGGGVGGSGQRRKRAREPDEGGTGGEEGQGPRTRRRVAERVPGCVVAGCRACSPPPIARISGPRGPEGGGWAGGGAAPRRSPARARAQPARLGQEGQQEPGVGRGGEGVPREGAR